MTDAKLCWLDIRDAGTATAAILEEAVHQRIDGVVAADPAAFTGLPPTVRKILLFEDGAASVPADLGEADLVIVPGGKDERAPLVEAHPDVEFGRYVEIVDADTLEDACLAARLEAWSVLDFRDPTKIPLEIVIAAAMRRPGLHRHDRGRQRGGRDRLRRARTGLGRRPDARPHRGRRHRPAHRGHLARRGDPAGGADGHRRHAHRDG